ncbi:Uncharacterised protein [Yersinia aldovae]|nr:Uncharacterised protein [Yersinia aldovae]
MNSLNTNVMKPVLKEVVFVGKAIADIKTKIINHDPEQVIRKANSTVVRDTVIFAVNMKLMKVVITPALHDLENELKRGLQRISSDFDDVDLHSWITGIVMNAGYSSPSGRLIW